MRVVLSAVAASLLLMLANHGFSQAALDRAAATKTSMELLVFEHPDCTYCQAFRSRVVPRYQASPHAAEAPLRFIDISRSDTGRLGLASPITMLPTAVLMKEGREMDRIAGYWAPDNFFKMVGLIISRAE
jgi:thioredoxin-related protein